MAMGSHNQVGSLGDFPSNNELWVGLHHHLDAGGFGGGGEAILGIGDHHPGDVDAVLAQHVKGGHAKVAGADESDPHEGSVRLFREKLSVDNTSGRSVTPAP